MDTVFVKPRRVLVAGVIGGLAALAWRIAASVADAEAPARQPGAEAAATAAAPARERAEAKAAPAR